jgi:hypothetical protein
VALCTCVWLFLEHGLHLDSTVGMRAMSPLHCDGTMVKHDADRHAYLVLLHCPAKVRHPRWHIRLAYVSLLHSNFGKDTIHMCTASKHVHNNM